MTEAASRTLLSTRRDLKQTVTSSNRHVMGLHFPAMSTARQTALARAHDAIRKFFDGTDKWPFTSEDVAKAVIDQVMPEIDHSSQLIGVPELSLLSTETRPQPTVYLWRGGQLVEADFGMTFDADSVINDEGPLTVLAMP